MRRVVTHLPAGSQPALPLRQPGNPPTGEASTKAIPKVQRLIRRFLSTRASTLAVWQDGCLTASRPYRPVRINRKTRLLEHSAVLTGEDR